MHNSLQNSHTFNADIQCYQPRNYKYLINKTFTSAFLANIQERKIFIIRMILHHFGQASCLWLWLKSLFMRVYPVCKISGCRLAYTFRFSPLLYLLFTLIFFFVVFLLRFLFFHVESWPCCKPKLTRDCWTLPADGVIISCQIHLSYMAFSCRDCHLCILKRKRIYWNSL